MKQYRHNKLITINYQQFLLYSERKVIIYRRLRHVLFDVRVGNSNLAKSLGEKSNHAMYQDEKPHRCLLSLQN